jgi:D-beta-D-heptose 7-phosphate kinase/D-beta-D-heptose 1-phosphate adenosyltransferase
MLRIDREETGLPGAEVTEKLQNTISYLIQDASAVIVSDYAKGTVEQSTLETIREQALARCIPWIVDPKPAHKNLYFGASAMTPNTKELSELTSRSVKTDDELTVASSMLVKELNLGGLLVTRSEKGMALVIPEAEFRDGLDGGKPSIWTVPTEAREVYDVSGAGDTVIATFTAALATKSNWLDAAMLANTAAGVVVAKMGTATATPQEILGRL